MLPAVPGHLARVFQFLVHHCGSFLEFPCVLQDVVATSRPIRAQSAANARPMRGQCAARAGLPEELRSSFLGVKTFQDYSRTYWGCLEACQGPRRSAGTARRATETSREQQYLMAGFWIPTSLGHVGHVTRSEQDFPSRALEQLWVHCLARSAS